MEVQRTRLVMPRRQSEEVNQSAKQVAEREPDDARQTTGRRQRPRQGVVKDQRGQDQPADKERAQSKR
jgi:hypothetical protein